AKAPLRLASQPHFWSRAASKFGKRHMRVWGRSAQQAEDCEAIPKKPEDGRWSLLQSDGFWLFHWPQTALCSQPYTKLAEIACKRVQGGSPEWSPEAQAGLWRRARGRGGLERRPLPIFVFCVLFQSENSMVNK
ncbi:MAG: hypothetical protein IJU12_12380, partial [Clostridia bacterium]|nr:hypothetical protein [Clostridia bacterium]